MSNGDSGKVCNHLIHAHFLSFTFTYCFVLVPKDLLHIHRSSTFLQLLSLARQEATPPLPAGRSSSPPHHWLSKPLSGWRKLLITATSNWKMRRKDRQLRCKH
ncbi:uncharacterized protein LOC126721982 [Quercus robur]|uniref:uncharacterized protein LOC126721982 n=1 Tax=Quercus robur TaxID=38942 RepID=UPI00216319F8|nr:uncharacterized protein LOC126721982 [Quercus robur]